MMIPATDSVPPVITTVASASGCAKTSRWIAAVVALASGGLLTLAATLTPSAGGLGTHTQLHLSECGWITLMDTPCLTCGMTTAFAHAANGNIVASFLTQPMGCVLAIVTAITLLVSSYVAATGSCLGGAFSRLLCARTAWMTTIFFLGAWIYKILSYKGLL